MNQFDPFRIADEISRRSHKLRLRCLPCLFTLTLLTSGCQQLAMLTKSPLERVPLATPRNPVTKTVCLWERGEGIGADGLPTRGFAGQILFFTSRSQEPVRVDGDIRIYVFDDQGSIDEQAAPISQFDFDSEQFQVFLRETNLGAAYQLFIPYTRTGNHQAACTIRVRLTPEGGRPIYSKMVDIMLPGGGQYENSEVVISHERKEPEIRRVVMQQAAAETAPPSDRITLPNSLRTQERQRIKSRLSDLAQGTTSKAPGQFQPRKTRSQPEDEFGEHPIFAD